MPLHPILGPAAFSIFFLVACGSAQPLKPGPRGTLRFKGEQKGALIEVDEVHLGPISMFESKGLMLRPGEHQIIIRLEGYFPEYRIVEIAAMEVVVLDINLRPVPP